MSLDPKAVELRIPLEILNEGKIDVIDEVMAPDMIEHMPPAPGVPTGIEGFKIFVRAFRAAFPDLHYDVVVHFGEGDLVTAVAQASGTMKGDFAGMPATGKKATWTEIHVSRVVNGKVVEHWGVVDQMAMLTQLGLMPGAPAGAAT
jgi:predicted ester cyclase